MQIFQKLKAKGYNGSYTILNEYIRLARPPKKKAFLTLSFAPGECAQIDFGYCGLISTENTRRRLYVFVMVLCYSRMMYLEFILKQSMEHFLSCHRNALEFFGGVPEKTMVDNCKVAILKHPRYGDVVPHPRYLDFAKHYGFSIKACNVRAPYEKGRVENGIGYTKKNFLNGLELPPFMGMNPLAWQWRNTVSNVRIHGETKEQPVKRFEKEKLVLAPLPIHGYDCAVIEQVKANKQCWVNYDSNRYSVPPRYAQRADLTLHSYPDLLSIYGGGKLIARHTRSYGRNRKVENPDHKKELVSQRQHARYQVLIHDFMNLTPKAQDYYIALKQRRFNPYHHCRKIMTLVEIHGSTSVARAIEDACEVGVYNSEYIMNLLELHQRPDFIANPLHITRKEDWLNLTLNAPSINHYNNYLNKGK